MELPVQELTIVIGFMVLANRLVALLITPLFERYGWDKFPIMYIAWVISGIFVWLSDVNLFVSYMPSELVGKILTAIVAGGGANLLHDLTNQPAVSISVEGRTE